MRNRNRRLSVIVDIIRNNHIGSQDQLVHKLKECGFKVTQATLSRDFKTLRIIKTIDSHGKSVYVVPDEEAIKERLLNPSLCNTSSPTATSGFISLEISGNIAVVKTRNGYAPGMAYDIDISRQPEILGTIPGSDTIFVVMKEGLSKKAATNVFSRLFPHAFINNFSSHFDD